MAIRRGGKTLTARQQAAYVREITGWTREQYKRERDLLYNRTRNYERIAGLKRGEIDVSDLLARRERGKLYARRAGQEWQPTAQLEAIMSAPASSVGRAPTQRARAIVDAALIAQAEREMGGVIHRSRYSAEFDAEIGELRARGELTGRAYYDTAAKYARELQNERENADSVNANIMDPTDIIFFSST